MLATNSVRLAANAVFGGAAQCQKSGNQHSYRGNYHIWETLVRWDKPEVYGTACKRVDCRSYQSPFNSKRRFREAWLRSRAGNTF